MERDPYSRNSVTGIARLSLMPLIKEPDTEVLFAIFEFLGNTSTRLFVILKELESTTKSLKLLFIPEIK